MILVDSSVWISYFNGKITPETDILDQILSQQLVAVGDLILTEVLQGFRLEKDYKIAKSLLLALPVYDLAGKDLAVKSANNFRKLRAKGITIRKTIDVIIATFCIENGMHLLHADKDFDFLTKHLELKTV